MLEDLKLWRKIYNIHYALLYNMVIRCQMDQNFKGWDMNHLRF